MGEVVLGTVYEINKNLMRREEKLSKPAFANKLKLVKNFFLKNGKYFMLLCNDCKDYTVFVMEGKTDESGEQAIKDLKECLVNRGETLSIDYAPGDQNAFEIWIRDDSSEPFCYYLFPYDNAVIEVK